MKNLQRKASLAVILILSGLGVSLVTLPVHATHIAFKTGDLFISVQFTGTGHVEHRNATGFPLENLTVAGAYPFPGDGPAGMAFDSNSNLYVTGFATQLVNKFNTTGGLVGGFGSGYNSDPESIVFNNTGFAYVGQADGARQIRLFYPNGTFIKAFSPSTGPRGTDWIDLDSDQCTVYYTSEGNEVKRFNVCTDTQLSDFATGLPGSYAYALRKVPSGGVLVADSQEVVRLNSTGSIVQTYALPGENSLFALNLDPDGTSFWTAGLSTATVYKLNIATGNLLLSFKTVSEDGIGGIAVLGEITSGCPSCHHPPGGLTVSKFFTDSSLNPLTKDTSGSPKVDVVLAHGVVRSTNPGQVLAWVNVTNTSGSPLQSLKLNETLPIDWRVSPAWLSAKGAIHVYFANTTSLITNPEITQPSTITVSTGNPETVSLAIPSFNSTAIGHSLLEGQSILLSVKLAYGLIKTTQSAVSYPRNYTDTAVAVAWTLASFAGTESTGSVSAFFIADAKVVS